MKSKTVDYYSWNCDWCDTENLILWTRLQAGAFCGACHRPLALPDTHGQVENSVIDAGRCQPC